MRLIDANAIPYNYTNERGVPMTREIDIQNMPTIEERKKGKWIIDGECVDCSVCRHDKWSRVPFEGLVKRFNFCPNCGADMRGEQDGKTNR